MAKRFWTTAHAAPDGEGWRVVLDARPVRLPGGAVLLLPTTRLAEAVAAEWRSAGGGRLGGDFSAADTPLTGLAGATQDRVAPHHAAVAEVLARYAEDDLLCYRAETPAGLAERQQARWQPWLEWAAQRHGARLIATTGIAHVPQPAASLAALRAAITARSPAELAALGVAIPALGSCVLGLALAEAALDAAAAFDLSALDELYQAERWGDDAEAAARRAGVRADVALAARFMELSRPATGAGGPG